MPNKYFGTDGIRGKANQHPITAEFALKIGMAIGVKFNNKKYKHRVVIGKDTRLSGYIIESALTAGLSAIGIDVFLVGPTPTPAVSMLTKSMRADIGIMISASHNPYYDNGIKIFNHDGSKLSDEDQNDIENLIDQDLTLYLSGSSDIGRVTRIDDASYRYIEYVKNSFSKNLSLKNLRIIIDCANGASYKVASQIFWELGADVITINNKPDGLNINNKCGSTDLRHLSDIVLQEKADIGIALDGDADRVAIIDNNGNEINGDKLIAVIAERLHDIGKLNSDLVVATKMSNLALEEYLNYIGISLIRTDIGDRNVVSSMIDNNCNFGGEQSGHIILSDHGITGDGLISALKILEYMIYYNKSSFDINNLFELYPQKLINISYNSDGYDPLSDSIFLEYINEQNNKLGFKGRIFARKSGTQNLIRILIESHDSKIIDNIVKDINNILKL